MLYDRILKDGRLLSSILLFYCTLTIVIKAQDNTFILSTNKLQPYYPAYIGNGHFSMSTSQFGILESESYMIKVYDHGKDDIPRIANLPSWNEVNYYNGTKWFDYSDSAEINNYSQVLDMFNGVLKTEYDWTNNNKKTHIESDIFISMNDKNLAVIRMLLTPDFEGVVRVSFPISQRERPQRKAYARLEKIDPNPPGTWPAEWYPGFTEVTQTQTSNDDRGGRITVDAQTDGRKTRVQIIADISFSGSLNNPKITTEDGETSANLVIEFTAEKGKTYTFYKGIHLSSEKENDFPQLDVPVLNLSNNYNTLHKQHKQSWNKLWATDILVRGDDNLQKIIHSMIFYLLCSIDENTGFSIPPMGLSSAGYYGHIFWDADTYMFPPLLFMHPGRARSMIDFRYNTLSAAKKNAAKNDYSGAMYPWEADELGNETTPYFAYQNALKENHIVGDVAFAQWQYYLATKDKQWLEKYGYLVIKETADFWVSRVHYNKEKDQYEIGKVVSVSESIIDISNETYTNSIAKKNLQIAIEVSEMLNKDINPKWREISDKILIPYNEEKEFHPTYESEPDTSKGNEGFWTSVVPLLSFPLQMEMSENAKRNNFLHAVTGLKEIGAGAMMGVNFLPIIAAELENDSLFNLTLDLTLKGYLKPPFNVLSETHTNRSINFITGAGAFLQQVIFGYTGLRLTEKGLVQKFQPMLPKNVKSITLKNFTVENQQVNITVEGNTLKKERVSE